MTAAQLVLDPEHQIGSLLKLGFQVSGARSKPQARAEEIAESLTHPDARVAFGGHFNAGKSTLLNALLGRNILPVDDLPETGVDCWIRAAGVDEASVLVNGQRRQIQVESRSLREWSGLVTDAGEHRPGVSQERRLHLGLAASPIPPNAVWIDTMGLDDDAQLDARLRQIMAEVDVLIWVINTNQPLGEGERAFLADFLTTHGPEAVVFVLNVILSVDTGEDFQSRLAKNRVAWRNRIEYFWRETVGDASQPVVLEVAARALATHPEGFGGPQLRTLLAELTGKRSPRVSGSRFHRAASAAKDLCSDIADSIAARQKEEEPAEGTQKQIAAAWQAFDARQYDQMLLHASAAADLAPRLPEPFLARSIALIMKQQAAFAEIAAARTLRLDPAFALGRFAGGWARFASGRYSEAWDDLDAFLSSKPAFWQRTIALYLRACCALSLNSGKRDSKPDYVDDLVAACADGAGLARIDEVPASLLVAAGYRLEKLSRFDEALALYGRASASIPTDPDAAYTENFTRTTTRFLVPVEGAKPVNVVRKRIWAACQNLHGGATREATQKYVATNQSANPHDSLDAAFCLHMASITAELARNDQTVPWLEKVLGFEPEFDIMIAKRDPYIKAVKSGPLRDFLNAKVQTESKAGVVNNYVKVTNTSAFKLTNIEVKVAVNRADRRPVTVPLLTMAELGAGQSCIWGDIFQDTGVFGHKIQTVELTVFCREAVE